MAVYYYPQLFEARPFPTYNGCDYEYFSPAGMIERITLQGSRENRVIQIYFRNVILGNSWLEKSRIAEKTDCNNPGQCQKLYCALKPLTIPKDQESRHLLRELKKYACFTPPLTRE